jgi:hypothetical protein
MMAEQNVSQIHTDELSAVAQQALRINLADAYTRLVVGGSGNEQARELLEKVSPHELLRRPVRDDEPASAMLAGLWLWHDWLEASHRIVQQIQTPTGSLWHAIMHRREGDFGNSKYWLARCRGHVVLASLGQHAGAILNPLPADKSLLRLMRDGWDAEAFVDLVQAVRQQADDPRHAVAVSLQQLEWRLLFDHCTRQAMAM